jgi:RNA recognition motif-containing protein
LKKVTAFKDRIINPPRHLLSKPFKKDRLLSTLISFLASDFLMVIILSKLPAGTKKEDIADYVRPVIRGVFYLKKGHIRAINILVLKDKQLNGFEYYGLVRIEPDEVAKRAIKKLNRKPFKGKRIAVREYTYKRLWQNDRRHNDAVCILDGKDRRRFDRRRDQLEIIDYNLESMLHQSRYLRKF